MPLYEIQHSYPLTTSQRTKIAQQITHLHSSAFLTPSSFVHVKFNAQDASDSSYYLAGKPQLLTTNRIIGMVRTSPSRSKADFDRLAEAIEQAWVDVVSPSTSSSLKNGDKSEKDGDGSQKQQDQHQSNGGSQKEEGEKEKKAKKLLVVAFYQMVGAREAGFEVPTAGEEKQWYQSKSKHFQEQADAGDEFFKDLIEEVETREDLRKSYLGE